MRIKCLAQAHNPFTQNRALLRTAQPGIQHSIHRGMALFLGDQSRHVIETGSIEEKRQYRGYNHSGDTSITFSAFKFPCKWSVISPCLSYCVNADDEVILTG